jgi:CheY-like chemotaxis protein
MNREAKAMQKRILVVDDDEMNLKRTKMILGKYYDVLLAESGKAALDKIRFQKIDLILLDIAMPDMDGMETFEHIKAFNIDIPVIFLTASGYEDDVLKAIKLGAVNYLKKPFYPQDLLERVAKEFEKE